MAWGGHPQRSGTEGAPQVRPGDAGVDFRREGTVRLCQGSRLEPEAQDAPPGGLASGNGSPGFHGQPVLAACSKASASPRRCLPHRVTHRAGLGRCRFLGPVSKLLSRGLCG